MSIFNKLTLLETKPVSPVEPGGLGLGFSVKFRVRSFHGNQIETRPLRIDEPLDGDVEASTGSVDGRESIGGSGGRRRPRRG